MLCENRIGSYRQMTRLGPIRSDSCLNVSITDVFCGSPVSSSLSYGVTVNWK